MKFLTALWRTFNKKVISKAYNQRPNFALDLTLNKVNSFTIEEVFALLVPLYFSKLNIVVLTNINIEAKNLAFWAKVPLMEMPHFMKDVIILRCKDKTEAIRLVENITTDFASATAYSLGVSILSNEEAL
jgi:hypothetical protein